jgi:hypothetical protein
MSVHPTWFGFPQSASGQLSWKFEPVNDIWRSEPKLADISTKYRELLYAALFSSLVELACYQRIWVWLVNKVFSHVHPSGTSRSAS